jgi:hypothetical protein
MEENRVRCLHGRKSGFHRHHGTEQPAKQPHLHEFAIRTPYLPAQSLGDRTSPKGTKEKGNPTTGTKRLFSQQTQTTDTATTDSRANQAIQATMQV